MPERTYNTLFLVESVDGKISSGDTDEMDVDKDWNHIPGLMEGMPQYYALEKQTDAVSFNTGRVMAKIGLNQRTEMPKQMDVSFVIVDNQPHLNEKGVEYLTNWVKHLYLVTTNPNHPALQSAKQNITVIKYETKIDFVDLFSQLKTKYQIPRVTLQSGGTMNAELVRAGVVDELLVVVAPALIGGKTTSTLMDGEALHKHEELAMIKTLELLELEKLENSFFKVRYKLKN